MSNNSANIVDISQYVKNKNTKELKGLDKLERSVDARTRELAELKLLIRDKKATILRGSPFPTFRQYVDKRIALGDLTLGERRYLRALSLCVKRGQTSQVVSQEALLRKAKEWGSLRSVKRAQASLQARGEIVVTHLYDNHGWRSASKIELTGYRAALAEIACRQGVE